MAEQEHGQSQVPIGGDNAPRGNLPANLLGAAPSDHAKRYAWPSAPAVLSTAVARVDGPDKVTGRATYTFDVQRPGMLYASTVRSPHLRARVAAIDTAAAAAAPGVAAVMVEKAAGGEVRYQGDLVAAVAADTEEHARDAARLVAVTYETLPHVSSEEQAMAPGAPQVFQGGNTRAGALLEVGDLDAGFTAAAHVLEATYSTHVITHVCLETHGAVCEWEGSRLTAWVSTQGVHSARQQFADVLKIPQSDVRVVCAHTGGAFGSKTMLDSATVLCARLARQAGRPVRLMFERKEEHLDSGNRPSAFARVRAGVSADGRVTAFDAQSWGTGGAGQGAGFPLPYIYEFPNRRRTHTDVFINTSVQRPMRAPGHPQGSYITELLMDGFADLAGADPIEFRIRHLPPAAPSARWADYYRMGATRFGWAARHATGDRAAGPIRRGMGAAACQWGGSGRAANVHVDILADGGVVVQCGTQCVGTGTRSVIAVVAAETLGLAPSAVKVEIGDTAFGFAGASGGSTTVSGVAPAVRIATGKALDALCARVAPALRVDPSALVASRGRIQVRGDTGKGMTWKAACKRLGAEPVAVDAEWEPGLSSVNTSGVQFAEVAVDVETGIVKVLRILAIQDCGLVVDKLTAESQVYGGVIGSLNFALFENRQLDRRTGQMVNPNMESYLLATMTDIPRVDVVLVNQPERGVIGVGEPPTVPTAAAIGNAVRNAIGRPVRSLPLTPQRILAALV